MGRILQLERNCGREAAEGGTVRADLTAGHPGHQVPSVPVRAYDIKTDLERIRSGELSWQFDGNVPYAALKENAPKKGERIRYQEIPFETYYMNDVYSRFLSEIDTAVFVRGDKVNIAYYGSSQPVMDLVGEYCRSCEQDQRQGIGRD